MVVPCSFTPYSTPLLPSWDVANGVRQWTTVEWRVVTRRWKQPTWAGLFVTFKIGIYLYMHLIEILFIFWWLTFSIFFLHSVPLLFTPIHLVGVKRPKGGERLGVNEMDGGWCGEMEWLAITSYTLLSLKLHSFHLTTQLIIRLQSSVHFAHAGRMIRHGDGWRDEVRKASKWRKQWVGMRDTAFFRHITYSLPFMFRSSSFLTPPPPSPLRAGTGGEGRGGGRGRVGGHSLRSFPAFTLHIAHPSSRSLPVPPLVAHSVRTGHGPDREEERRAEGTVGRWWETRDTARPFMTRAFGCTPFRRNRPLPSLSFHPTEGRPLRGVRSFLTHPPCGANGMSVGWERDKNPPKGQES